MKKIAPAELKAWMEAQQPFVMIDVRETWEREAYHIGGLHIPLSELAERRQEIPKDVPVVLYCEKGIRSAIVIQRMEQAGYDNLYNLTGGMSEWKKA